MIRVKNLCKTFKNGRREVAAVQDVNLQVEAGDFVHVVGRSGSGKTTLLNLLAGLLLPTSGEINICGHAYEQMDEGAKTALRNTELGFIPQQAVSLPALTVIENIALPFYLAKREGDAYGRARYLAEQLDIKDLAQAYPSELSGGELRRLLIARALMNEPCILIADEPTADLDVENTNKVMDILKKINQDGVTLLVVTHELDTLRYGKTVYRMEAGHLSKEEDQYEGVR